MTLARRKLGAAGRPDVDRILRRWGCGAAVAGVGWAVRFPGLKPPKKFAQDLHRIWVEIRFAQLLHKPSVAHFLHMNSYPALPINTKYVLISQWYCGVVMGNER